MSATPLALTDVQVGLRLPDVQIEITATRVIATALASRDFEDAHHDRDAAQSRGLKDIFMNIFATNGLVIRYVTDWAGPDAIVERSAVKLGVPNYAGDVMTLSGEVSAVTPRTTDVLVEITVRGHNSLGEHVTADVSLSMTKGPR